MTDEELLSYIKSELRYEPETGHLFWINSRPGVAAGKRAGTKTPEGYNQLSVARRSLRAARIAFVLMTGRWPDGEIDHINGDRADDQWSNLRDVPTQVNLRNRRRPANNSSGAIGVYKSKNRWRATIADNGKLVNIGTFATVEEAAAARARAAVRLGYHENHGRAP
jgi:hypothetical protein